MRFASPSKEVEPRQGNGPSHLSPSQHRRLLLAALLLVGALVVAASGPAHAAAATAVAWAAPLLGAHPAVGAAVFVVLSALSAMVAFFSTALITPLAIEAFGPFAAFLLLWLGWVLGGVAAFGVGRWLGPSVAGWFLAPDRLRGYVAAASSLVRVRHVFLFQLALPSEVPGYVLGLAGCGFRTFLLGMAIAELPVAAGVVFLGESFLARDATMLAAFGAGGLLALWFAYRYGARWGQSWRPQPPSSFALDSGSDVASNALRGG
jgi:uncharacterized membrane protein YdjX (TVP38/TMEM64 family)